VESGVNDEWYGVMKAKIFWLSDLKK
jgi:hypothetical protein